MRLKSLKLAGFKSFANATTFTFPRGITAIVGPNGCGKSNVIDAIRWVLGESSAKQLRGGAMSDVIFAGTQEKSAKSVASVELTFEHTQDEQNGIRHEFNLYQELSVRRQVNLEGRSDYFINGTRCRRRDVVDVFLGTGLGARSYAVIEQGMIGRIVESNPMQLREFIEEAAGVSRYQARREETQKKLSMTQENLTRLHDIQSELVRQQKTLSKQAGSAQRYNELNTTLADIKQQLAIQQLYQAKQLQQQHKVAHEHSVIDNATLQTAYEQLKSQQDKLTAHINQEQWLKDEAQSTHYQQQLRYQQAEYQRNDIQAQSTQIEQQLVTVETQREQIASEINKLKAQEAEQQSALAALQPQLAELNVKRKAHKQDEQPLQRTWYESQHNLSRLQDSERKLEQQQALNTQSQKRHQQNYDKWDRRQQSWQALWERLQADSTSHHADAHNDTTELVSSPIELLNRQMQHITRQQDSIAERLSELQPQAHILQQHLTEQQRTLAEQEKQQALLAGEYDTLHQIVHPKPVKNLDRRLDKKAANQNKTISESCNRDELPITTLRERIELTVQGQQHAYILDDLLALWLDSHVLLTNQPNKTTTNDNLQSDDNLGQGLSSYLPELLQYQHQNSAKNELRHSLWLPAMQEAVHKNDTINSLPSELANKVVSLSQLIAQPVLMLWEQCYLYLANADINSEKTVEEVADILKVLPSFALLLTPNGWMMSSLGTINLNKLASMQGEQSDNQNESHFLTQRLQQRTRLEQLETLLDNSETQIQARQQTIKQQQRDYDALNVSLEETRAQADRLTQDHYRCQQQLTIQQAEYQRIKADEQRLNTDKIALEQEREELSQEQAALASEQQQIQDTIKILTPQLSKARITSQRLQAERTERSRARQSDDDTSQALQLSIQKVEIQLEHSSSSLIRANESYEQSVRNEQALLLRLKQYQQQSPDLQATLQALKMTRDEQQVVLSERETVLAELKQTHTTQQIELDALQNDLQAQQSKLASQATELALSEQRLQDASTHAHEALAEHHKISSQYQHNGQKLQPTISVSSLLTDFITYERRVRPDKIIELQREHTQLEQQLSNIGAVNLTAIAELAQVNERLEPLAQQTEDIAASMNTLTNAIASIDETTKTLFMQTLDAVNSELATLFAKVFGGGHASLTLNTDDLPDNISADKRKSEQWRAGLTLMAQPKGKRNSRLAVLSGGEKTLTALSLIFAIFKQHPAPFCVLDEVDAPLDDANVARFTSLIHELADDLQFIFISHNKLSMQIADELKGITMPSAGISTLVSVSLADAAQYIES